MSQSPRDGNLYPQNSKLRPLSPKQDEDFEEFVEVPRDVYYEPAAWSLVGHPFKNRNDRVVAAGS